MENELITTTENKVQIVDDNMLKDYLKAFCLTSKLNDNEITQFTEVAKAFQLNPFKREIYCIAYGEGKYRKLSIITGYESYIKRAEESGKLAGWKVWTEGEGKKLKALIQIDRHDWKSPFKHEVLISEYHQGNKIWNEKPATMIKKVAIAQGFRLAFPCSVGGMPYTNDELPTEMTQEKVVEPVVIPKKEAIVDTKKKGNILKFIEFTKAAKSVAELETIKNLLPLKTWTKDEMVKMGTALEDKLQELENAPQNKDVSFEDTI